MQINLDKQTGAARYRNVSRVHTGSLRFSLGGVDWQSRPASKELLALCIHKDFHHESHVRLQGKSHTSSSCRGSGRKEVLVYGIHGFEVIHCPQADLTEHSV